MIKEGTTFTICSHHELIKKGWIYRKDVSEYIHDDFPDNIISYRMIDENEGKILTVKSSVQKDWYGVKENTFYWPVATFLEIDLPKSSSHTCQEGMTPIYNWFICKICGDNLREIK